MHDVTKSRPDLALEVVWTGGGLNKLEVYRRLGVPEVWFWIEDRVEIHLLSADGYVRANASAAVPGFPFELITELLGLPSLSAVRRRIREVLSRG